MADPEKVAGEREERFPVDLDAVLARVRTLAGVTNDAGTARALGVCHQTLSSWKRRSTIPYHCLLQFALEHGTTLDYLLLGRNVPCGYTRGLVTAITTMLSVLPRLDALAVLHEAEGALLGRQVPGGHARGLATAITAMLSVLPQLDALAVLHEAEEAVLGRCAPDEDSASVGGREPEHGTEGGGHD